MATRALSELMERVRARGEPWSEPHDLRAERADVVAAWDASEDPFAMLLLLAALHPGRHERACEALVARMASFPPMRREAERQEKARPGMTYNGPDRFRFLHVAQRVRFGLSELSPEERRSTEARLADAIRVVVADPFSLLPGV